MSGPFRVAGARTVEVDITLLERVVRVLDSVGSVRCVSLDVNGRVMGGWDEHKAVRDEIARLADGQEVVSDNELGIADADDISTRIDKLQSRIDAMIDAWRLAHK